MYIGKILNFDGYKFIIEDIDTKTKIYIRKQLKNLLVL